MARRFNNFFRRYHVFCNSYPPCIYIHFSILSLKRKTNVCLQKKFPFTAGSGSVRASFNL